MKPIIELAGIQKSFDNNPILKGIDLRANKGEVVAIIGSSGSGKSTLLRCVNLLEMPQAGNIRVGEEEISIGDHSKANAEQVRRMRSRLGMVFQSFNLWAHMTVQRNLTEAPIQVLGMGKQEAQERALMLLRKVGIADKAKAYPNELSGGQQQRVAIARALAIDPLALLLDEPTSALDPELEVEVLKVIRSLSEEGRTMLLVTHDMGFARDIAHRVVFLHQGRIEEEGTPEDIFTNPKSARLQQFLNPS